MVVTATFTIRQGGGWDAQFNTIEAQPSISRNVGTIDVIQVTTQPNGVMLFHVEAGDQGPDGVEDWHIDLDVDAAGQDLTGTVHGKGIGKGGGVGGCGGAAPAPAKGGGKG